MNSVVRRTSIFLAPLSALLVSACSVPTYHEPVTGGTARLRVITTQAANTAVYVLPAPEGDCVTAHTDRYQWLAILGLDMPRKGRQGVSVGIPGATGLVSTSFAEATIPSGQPFVFEMTRTAYNYGCTVDVAFEPGIGKDYEASFSADGKQCHVRLSEVIENSDGSVARNVVNTSRVKFCTY